MRLPKHLYVQVLIGILVGGAIGFFWPLLGTSLKPVGDLFVNLVKMLLAPIIFTTVVAGLAGMGDLKKVGRVGLRSLLYFEVVTTLALIIGLSIANGFTPGAGFHATAATLVIAKWNGEFDASLATAVLVRPAPLSSARMISHAEPAAEIAHTDS